jgi:6-phosphogluconolactonase
MLVVLVFTVGSCAAFSQSSSTSSATGSEYLYVVTSPDEVAYAYRIDSDTGALAPVSGQPFPIDTGASPHACSFGCYINPVADPLGRFLFYDFDEIPNSGFGNMRVNPGTGALSDGSISLVTSGDTGPISTDPKGRFIFGNLTDYGHSSGSNQIQSYVVHPDGHLSPAPGQPDPYGGNEAYSAPTASDSHVYVSNYNTNVHHSSYLYGFSINPEDGGLTPASTTPDGMEPTNQAITLSGKFLYSDQDYSTSGPVDVEIVGFKVNPNGSLTPIDQAPQKTPDQAGVGLVISPNSNFLYHVAPGDVRAYAINQDTGKLTLTAVYTDINQSGGSLVIDPAVKYVYLNQTTYPTSATVDYKVRGFRVNPNTGELTPLPGKEVSFDKFPTGMAIVRPQN